jgi:energy-coupling factor transport system permease protein
LKNAQISRGASFQGNVVKKWQAVIPILMPLFVAIFRRSDELAVAMEARCYHLDGRERTSFRTLAFGSGDFWFLSAGSLIVFVLFLELM